MAVLENIKVAEAHVGELQDQLGSVETLLEQVEHAVVEGKKAGRCFRRFFRLLLLVALVAAVVIAVKKVLGGRSTADEIVIKETVIEGAVVDEDGNVIEETIVDDVVVAVDGEVVEEAVIIEAGADESDDAS